VTPLLGIDISHHQGRAGMSLARFRALRDAGVSFCIIRASIGTLTDGAFGVNRTRAERMGMAVGAYHYLVPAAIAAPEDQMDRFVSAVDANGGHDIPMVVDVEWAKDAPRLFWRRDVRPAGRRVRSILGGGHPVGLYTSAGYWEALGNPPGDPTFDYLWQARWTIGRASSVSELPASPPLANFGGWRNVPLWQFGALSFTVGAGRPHELDGDAFYGSIDEFRSLGTVLTPRPVEHGRRFRKGFNAMLESVLATLPTIQAPTDPGSGDQFPLGVAAARDAVEEAIGQLRIGPE